MVRILVVDDEEPMTVMLQHLWSTRFDAHVETAPTAEDALARIGQDPPDIIVSDYAMPGMNGLELLHHARGQVKRMALMTGYDDPDLEHRARAVGVDRCVQKSGRIHDWIALMDDLMASAT